MNLEKLEERILNYLQQAEPPLVPLHTLHEFCQREKDCGELGERELYHFLARHERIHVIGGPGPDAQLEVAVLANAGIETGPSAILDTRIPAPREMMAMLAGQLQAIRDVLEKALAESGSLPEHQQQLQEALARTDEIYEKMKRMQE
jgi:hypothetical protein